MNKDYGIFKNIVEGNLTVTVNDFGGFTHKNSDVKFPFQAKITDFGIEECEVLNIDNGKKYSIYNVSIEEFDSKNKYSDYVWKALTTYFKIRFIIDNKEYQEEQELLEQIEYLMQDIGISI